MTLFTQSLAVSFELEWKERRLNERYHGTRQEVSLVDEKTETILVDSAKVFLIL